MQRASFKALANGVTLPWILEELQSIEPRHNAPILLMSYLNPLLAFGLGRLPRAAAQAGVAGFIVPDLPFEESAELQQALDSEGLALVQMVTPVTPPDRPRDAVQGGQGFHLCRYHDRNHREVRRRQIRRRAARSARVHGSRQATIQDAGVRRLRHSLGPASSALRAARRRAWLSALRWSRRSSVAKMSARFCSLCGSQGNGVKRVFRAASLLQVAHARNVLIAAGIDSELRNQYLAGALGDLPMLETWPQLWVEDDLESAALRALERAASAPSGRGMDLPTVRRAARTAIHHLLALRRSDECIACAIAEGLRVASAESGPVGSKRRLFFKELQAPVRQTPTGVNRNSEPRISPQPLLAHAAQVTNCRV